MSDLQTRQKVIDIVRKYAPEAKYDVEEDLYTLGLDSLKTIALMVELEKEFNVNYSVNSIKLDSFRTLNRIYKMILSLRKKNPA